MKTCCARLDLSPNNPPTPPASACWTKIQPDEDMLCPTASITQQSADPYGFGVLEQAALVQLRATRALPKSGQEHTQGGHDL